MQAEFNFIEHARTAVERSASGLARLRHRLELGNANMGRQHRLTVEHALTHLERRHAVLMEHYERMLNASDEALSASWRDFLWCYDEYLQAVHEAKCELVPEEYWDDVTNAAALAPLLPSETGRAAPPAHAIEAAGNRAPASAASREPSTTAQAPHASPKHPRSP